jgi:hypothetical protein
MLDNQSRRVKRHPASTSVIAKNPIRLTGGRLFLLCEASIRLPHTPYHPCDQGERADERGRMADVSEPIPHHVGCGVCVATEQIYAEEPIRSIASAPS